MKVIFLDFDGVLITRDSPQPMREIPIASCVQALQRIIDTVQPQIVVSSSWRLDVADEHRIEFLQGKLTEFGLTNFRLLDSTPFISGMNVTRGDEIRAWLNDPKTKLILDAIGDKIERFAIIDDNEAMGDDLFPFFFRTKWADGLTDQIADKVISFLTKE